MKHHSGPVVQKCLTKIFKDLCDANENGGRQMQEFQKKVAVKSQLSLTDARLEATKAQWLTMISCQKDGFFATHPVLISGAFAKGECQCLKV